MRFKNFLLAEQQEFLAHKIADILSAVQELLAGGKQIGARQLVRSSEIVAGNIRKILHSSWTRSDKKHLKSLQKCGVAIMRAISDRGDLSQILNDVRAELEKISGNMGEPVNSLAAPKQTRPPSPEQMQSPPQTQASLPSD